MVCAIVLIVPCNADDIVCIWNRKCYVIISYCNHLIVLASYNNKITFLYTMASIYTYVVNAFAFYGERKPFLKVSLIESMRLSHQTANAKIIGSNQPFGTLGKVSLTSSSG